MFRFPRRSIAWLVLILGIAASVEAQVSPLAEQHQPIADYLSRVGDCPDCLVAQTAPDWSGLLQQEPPPAQPQHTGFRALIFDTAADFNAFPRRPSTWAILAIGGATAALVHPFDDDLNDRLRGSATVRRIFAPGKYLGSARVQVAAATSVYLIGRFLVPKAEGEPRTNKISHLGFDLVRAVIMSEAIAHTIKATVRRNRPTGECCAFPSGHAAVSFATASVLERHLGYRAAWPTLLIATYIGASRMHDNRHFASDVAFGAAIGIASGWTVVGRHGRTEYALVPTPTRGGAMVSLVMHPRLVKE